MNKKSTFRSVANNYLTHPIKENGITLVALVVTIIVLLILAGITISLVLGQNGVIQRAKDSKVVMNEAQIKEELQLAIHALQPDYHTSNNTGTFRDYIFSTDTGKGQEKLKSELGASNLSFDTTNHRITYKGIEFEVAENGTMIKVGGSESVGGNNNEQSQSEPLKIGDDVNYITSLNNVTLDKWKVFYVDGDYTYIILDGYLPNTAIDTTTMTGLAKSSGNNWYTNEEEIYGVAAQENRAQLINAMNNKENWDSLLTGNINGKAVNQIRTTNVWAIGSPTLELWVNSWNTIYPDDTLYISQTETLSDGFKGYYIGESADPYESSSISLADKDGYGNSLFFFPVNSEYEYVDDFAMYGYWLATSSAYESEDIMVANCNGELTTGDRSQENPFRPVICLPSNIVNQ